jgi:nucleotide-binding universal stress UspA family protein
MERIVVGVDGSACADAALRFAAQEARDHGAGLEVVHAWSFPAFVGSAFAPAAPIDPVVVEETAKGIVAEAVDRVLGPAGERDLEVDEVVQAGSATEVLLARAGGARALVLGTRGHGGFVGLLLGSVSQQCAHHAPCPLVIVPAP